MKKLLLLTALGATIATPATAVQQCININASTACSAGTTNGERSSTWTVSCGLGLQNVSGVALCATTNAAAAIAKPIYATDSTQNLHCYCKMTSPATSSFFVRSPTETFIDTAACTKLCAQRCAETFVDSNTRTYFLRF